MSNVRHAKVRSGQPPFKRLPADYYVDGILSGNRAVMGRAFSVIESDSPNDEELAEQILERVLPRTGRSRRIGISGVPGSGKSTLIDALGMYLLRERGENIAVLSIDPSSPISGGSILGDKTRMERLSGEPNAFIRPSPSRGYLGGVAHRTRECMLVCEAAGYQNVLIETVGVGQSETEVTSMTDFFLLLMIPGAGDELQGIKRGIIEMVDGIVINKADGENVNAANRARGQYESALRMFAPNREGLTAGVLTCSALENRGIGEVWQMILDHLAQQEARGQLHVRRQAHALTWMRELISSGLRELFHNAPAVQERLGRLESSVGVGATTPVKAARELLDVYRDWIRVPPVESTPACVPTSMPSHS
ncbi:MAG: methylmalonyl Co-A mutase-associated GTPase MeaB [Verrucomicrobia bacterium]|nr:methylmalonyl Co-A mutase-associated GTPase MeaB [Verrucomicrobiota bacterium]